MKYLYLIIFLLSSNIAYNQSACDLFQIVSIHDFPANPDQPGGNYFVMLLTVTQDLDDSFDPFYASLYFEDADKNKISESLDFGYTLPKSIHDTIPYLMKILSDESNQDFPKDKQTFLVVKTANNPPNPTECIVFFKSQLTGTQDHSENRAISVFPIPVKDNLNIRGLEIEEISIWDEQGNLILNQRLNNKKTINVEHLESGFYMLTVLTPEGIKHAASFIKF